MIAVMAETGKQKKKNTGLYLTVYVYNFILVLLLYLKTQRDILYQNKVTKSPFSRGLTVLRSVPRSMALYSPPHAPVYISLEFY
jgi:hypothetical protein